MNQTVKHSLLIFVSGLSYGLIVPFLNFAYATGATPIQVLSCEYVIAIALLALFVGVFRRAHISRRQFLRLLGAGVVSTCSTLCYSTSLQLLPPNVAITLLFQFAWMGVVLEAIVKRRLPGAYEVVAAVVILVGTFFATGLIAPGGLSFVEGLNPLGLAAGVGSAVFYTLYLYLSSRVATELPTPCRSLCMLSAGLVLTVAINPAYVPSAPQIFGQLTWIAPALAAAGILVPQLLIAHSAPHLPAGLTTIMASSELPSGILCSIILLGDTCTPEIVLGVLLVLGGIALSQLWPLVRRLPDRVEPVQSPEHRVCRDQG
jgi:drug/metabolite transporter (DMT)-like permease